GFEAGLVVLGGKGWGVGGQDCGASWVYRVAYRLALRARTRAARQQATDRAAVRGQTRAAQAGDDPLSEVTGRDLSRVLDEELSRLPEWCRAPLVLCYLQGATRDEAALQLGWPLGTLSHRLEQGRALLRTRLSGRGLALSTVLPGALLGGEAARAAVPAALADTAIRAALALGTGTGAALAGHALRAFVASRPRVLALVL